MSDTEYHRVRDAALDAEDRNPNGSAEVDSTTIIQIDAKQNWRSLRLWELWEARELLYFLNLRDIKVRYKQTLLGSLWAIIHPVVTMVVFTVFFGELIGLGNDVNDIPYAVFVFSGLLLWNLFSGIFSKTSNCVVASTQLVNKVYFPRLALPISSIGVNLIDCFIGFVVLIAMMLCYGVSLSPRLLLAPLPIILVVVAALGLSTFLAALTAFYRDFQFISAYVLQLWLYITPVIYPTNLVPQKWKLIFSLNPLVGPVEGFRYLLFAEQASFDPTTTIVSMISAFMLLAAGVFYYNATAPMFPDCV